MYRAIFTADLHASNTLPYAKRDPMSQVSDRLKDVLEVLHQIDDYSEEHGIKDLWILGDLFDRRLLDAVTLQLVCEKLAKMDESMQVFLLPGNHEAHDASCKRYTIEMLGELGCHIMADPSVEWQDHKDNVRFRVLPFMPEEEARTAIGLMAKDPKVGESILLTHATIRGGRIGKWITPDGLTMEELTPFIRVLAGHFHTPQTFSDISYLGAPLQHHFGDAGEKRGFWDIKFKNREIDSMKMVSVNAPEFVEHEDNDVEQHSSWPKPPVKGYYRIKLRATHARMKLLLPESEVEMEKIRTSAGLRYGKVEPILAAEVKTRLDPSSEGRSWAEMVTKYVEAVEPHGLDRDELVAIGKQAVEEVEL